MQRIDPRSDSYSALMFDVITNAHRYVPKPGDLVLDLGAHFGMFSLYCAARGCLVKAYEPSSKAFGELLHTCEVAAEIGLGAIDANKLAIWNGSADFRLLSQASDSSGTGSIVLETPFCERVQCITLRQAMNGDTYDCVKVDIEGAEYEVFRVAEQEDFDRMRFLTIEIHNDILAKEQCRQVVAKLIGAFPHHQIIPVKVNGQPTEDVATLICWR